MDSHQKGKNGSITRRDFLKGTTAGIIAASVSPLFPAGRLALASSDMRLGVIAPSHCAAAYYVAELSGRFKESGLNAEIVPYTNMGMAAKDLAAGNLQAAQLTVPLFLALRAGKGPVSTPQPLLATQITGTDGGAIVTGNNSGIGRLSDLEGKAIASHTPLTVHYLILATLMERKKFSSDSMKNIRVTPLNEVIPSLKKGEIDAFIMPEPVNSMATFKKAGDMLVTTRVLWPGHPCCLTATTENFASGNKEMYQVFTDAMVRTGYEMDSSTTRSSMLSILKKAEPYSKLPPTVLSSAFSQGLSGFSPYPHASSFMAAKVMMRRNGLLDDNSLPGKDSGLNTDFIETAHKNLDIPLPKADRTEKVAGEKLA